MASALVSAVQHRSPEAFGVVAATFLGATVVAIMAGQVVSAIASATVATINAFAAGIELANREG